MRAAITVTDAMTDEERKPRMHIGEMAEKSGVSSRTLRHYEAIGLLPPTGRSEGGFRIYTEEDLRRFMTIRRMKALGYSTAEMGRLLKLLDIAGGDVLEAKRADARAELDAMRTDARTRREKLARQVERADEFLSILDHRLK
ncbi:MerR family transcriptional regulator [Kocuria rosea]|uniref:MerR family transcriptional regulator n=1 Tax=Kocuria rosea TaxID=1275 RepID=UPI0025B753AC|nr:MerR family transcriptional regulator [Kocuria rosea]WJZ68552.1 MerR family transcriptional regulator [Kocuria rosea]